MYDIPAPPGAFTGIEESRIATVDLDNTGTGVERSQTPPHIAGTLPPPPTLPPAPVAAPAPSPEPPKNVWQQLGDKTGWRIQYATGTVEIVTKEELTAFERQPGAHDRLRGVKLKDRLQMVVAARTTGEDQSGPSDEEYV